jgi:hypothetical protein
MSIDRGCYWRLAAELQAVVRQRLLVGGRAYSGQHLDSNWELLVQCPLLCLSCAAGVAVLANLVGRQCSASSLYNDALLHTPFFRPQFNVAVTNTSKTVIIRNPPGWINIPQTTTINL